MHPEYPCAHCVQSAAAAAVIEALLGAPEIPEVALTSATAPGIIHRFTNPSAFADEVASARIWAGFHYRFSTRVGTDLGRKVGSYVVQHAMQLRRSRRADFPLVSRPEPETVTMITSVRGLISSSCRQTTRSAKFPSASEVLYGGTRL
jgi:hypothetical protein